HAQSLRPPVEGNLKRRDSALKPTLTCRSLCAKSLRATGYISEQLARQQRIFLHQRPSRFCMTLPDSSFGCELGLPQVTSRVWELAKRSCFRSQDLVRIGMRYLSLSTQHQIASGSR